MSHRELLTWRQPDQAAEVELLLAEIVFERGEPLLPGLEFHLRAGDVDAGHDSGIVAIHRLLESRLGGGHLRARRFDAGRRPRSPADNRR